MDEKQLATTVRILGIDPGTTIMGFGLIKVVGKKMEFLQLNELQLKKYDDHYLKLKLIFERTVELIDTHHPDEIAIEAPFFGKNVQSMLKLGRAQGVAMAAGLSREVPITEYAPKKIKMAITGNGNASKEQVAKMFAPKNDPKEASWTPKCSPKRPHRAQSLPTEPKGIPKGTQMEHHFSKTKYYTFLILLAH